MQASFDEKSRLPARARPPRGGLELKFASAQVRVLEEERGMTIINDYHWLVPLVSVVGLHLTWLGPAPSGLFARTLASGALPMSS